MRLFSTLFTPIYVQQSLHQHPGTSHAPRKRTVLRLRGYDLSLLMAILRLEIFNYQSTRSKADRWKMTLPHHAANEALEFGRRRDRRGEIEN